MGFATVYPLVSARAVARPFTYEVPDDVGCGAVVSVPFGRSRVRGVVVSTGEPPPAGVEAAPIAAVLDELPPALVELALWLARYYGSTPARALELVAPRRRARRGEPRETPAGLVGEPAPAELTPEQSAAVASIVAAMDAGGGRYLLYGATGSGKTEVYLQACAAALERGLGAIVLVPEIALTPQAVGRFRARFGTRIALLHSGLTEAARRDERERIASGEARVVVGARSAVFAPVRGLGLVCVDEEHDASYKQESDPRYDARTVAAKRASLEGAVAVFGSATPRPESWAALERLELGGRLGGKLPPVRVVDLRRERGYPLSAPLLAELGDIAEKGGKAILLLNRRGLIPAIHCRTCGVTRRCPNCDVALVLHGSGELRCHHCGHGEPAPELCPECGSAELARLGAGTQRLERELAARLPELELVRLDADSRDPSAALERFAATDRAVLLGTQMVAKGHHFKGVSLAAVVDADTGLALPDFRAEERTFQLLTQLAGRSGRDAPGRVLIQTFQPDARPVELAARHDVGRFLAGELERREALGYPPFRHLIRIVVSGPEADAPMQALQELKAALTFPGTGRSPPPGDGSRRRRSARAGAAPAAARTPSRAARRQDRPAGSPRGPCCRRRLLRPLRRCGRRALPPWSTSIRRASEYTDLGVSEEHGQVIDEELSAENEARRRLALAQIRQWPDPVLKLRAEEVEDFDDDLRRLVARMQALMADAHGVGLAGNQAGVLRRLFVFRIEGEDEARAAVNPAIVDASEELETADEGCLSLQGVLVPVERPRAVTLEAHDAEGTPFRLELEGLAARVVQHELDHLDGVLILERTTPEARREAMAALRPQPILG